MVQIVCESNIFSQTILVNKLASGVVWTYGRRDFMDGATGFLGEFAHQQPDYICFILLYSGMLSLHEAAS